MRIQPVFICSTFLSVSLFASTLVPELPEAELSKDACMLIMSNKKPTRNVFSTEAMCSATLFSSTNAATAAHCLVGFKYIFMLCPNQRPRRVIARSVPDDFPRDLKSGVVNCRQSKHDVGVLQFSPPIKTVATRLPKSADEVEKLTNKNAKCKIFGYGLDDKDEDGDLNGRNVQFGDWEIGREFHDVDENGNGIGPYQSIYSRVNSCGAFMIKGKFKPKHPSEQLIGIQREMKKVGLKPLEEESVVRGGDSGGGLVCKDENGKDVLTGITSGVGINGEPPEPVASSISLGPTLALVTNTLMTNLIPMGKDLPPERNLVMAPHAREDSVLATRRTH